MMDELRSLEADAVLLHASRIHRNSPKPTPTLIERYPYRSDIRAFHTRAKGSKKRAAVLAIGGAMRDMKSGRPKPPLRRPSARGDGTATGK